MCRRLQPGGSSSSSSRGSRSIRGEAGPSKPADPGAGARWDDEQAEKRKQEAAKEEDVDVEVLSQQFSEVYSPPKPPPPKKPRVGGDVGSSSQAVELTETEE